VQAGRRDDAERLYRDVLGGIRHLAWKLGEMARGLRILRGFLPVCPDRDAMAWFLRGLGELDEAYALHPMAYFRADVRLLQGRLPEVAAEGSDARTIAAAFLMGESREPPPDVLSLALPRDQLLLYLGRLQVERHSAALTAVYGEFGRGGDRAQHQLIQAEVAMRETDPDACRRHLGDAARWILHAGSVEHLCYMHLIQTRAARSTADHEAAERAVDAGLQLARRCGLRLYHIELLCERAELLLCRGDTTAAEESAKDALERALAPDCRFAWGAAAAHHLLGTILAARGDREGAVTALRLALERRRRLGDPQSAVTEKLLRDMES
jgi:hypothetical protein